MKNKIIEYKIKLEELKESDLNIDKSMVSKLLVMANLAELAIISNIKLSKQEIHEYFQAKASVGRYFCDWKLDWVAEGYIDIVYYIKENDLSEK